MAARRATAAKMLPEVAWHVSTKSDAGSGNCVEAGPILDGSGQVAVRDTKDRGGPVLVYTADSWTAFLAAIRTARLS
jgi:hypothetical protein